MEFGSLGYDDPRTNSEVKNNVLKTENEEPTVGDAAASFDAGKDDVRVTDVGGVNGPPLFTFSHLGGPVQSTSPVLGKSDTCEEQTEAQQLHGTVQQNEAPVSGTLAVDDTVVLKDGDSHEQNLMQQQTSTELEDTFDDMIVIKDGVITSASPGEFSESLDAPVNDIPHFGFSPFITNDGPAANTEALLKPEPGLKNSARQVPLIGEYTVTQGDASGNVQEGEHTETDVSIAANHQVSEEDVQAIKGQKVRKKFGRKIYSGDVKDYDPETKWFKVVYEDGDEEDLEIWEVKPLLSQPLSSKKRSRATDELSKKGPKKGRRDSGDSTSKKNATGRKSIAKSPQSSKTPKTSAVEENAGKRSVGKSAKAPRIGAKSPQKERTGKGEKSHGKSVAKSPKTPRSQKTAKERGVVGTKTPRNRKAKTVEEAEISGRLELQSSTKKATKLPVRKRKVEEMDDSAKPDKDTTVELTSKNLETGDDRAAEPSEADKPDEYVGRAVKKDLGGTVIKGLVVSVDEKTRFYKVKYEDDNEEELEVSDLKMILDPVTSSIGTGRGPQPTTVSTRLSQEIAQQ